MVKERQQYRKTALAEFRAKQKQEQHDKIIDRWERGLPKKYQGFDLLDIMKDKWGGRLSILDSKIIKQYAKKPKGFLILSGGEGRGKSTIAATIVTEYLELNSTYRFPVYASVPTLLNDFSKNFEGNLRDQVARCDLLVLDDVGASSEGITPFQKKALWSVISDRWADDLPTIMTTNMSITSNESGVGLMEWFGESAWARIRDNAKRVEFIGDSFRSS